MINVEELIPKDKFDDSNIDKLKMLSDEQIKPILPKLLEWIQDCNWPVARVMPPILAMHQECMIPLLKDILAPEEEDNIWKYYIIIDLLPLFTEANLRQLLPLLKRIAETPTSGECLEEVDLEAKEFLEKRV